MFSGSHREIWLLCVLSLINCQIGYYVFMSQGPVVMEPFVCSVPSLFNRDSQQLVHHVSPGGTQINCVTMDGHVVPGSKFIGAHFKTLKISTETTWTIAQSIFVITKH